jgi:predicted metal-dependent HD superfamily phosphohydrolase
MNLLDRWKNVWQHLGAEATNQDLFQRLVDCYSESHRRYHTMEHLDECFEHLETVGSFADRPAEVELALWFHDAIYDTRKNDNEKRSADWAHESALSSGLEEEQANRIHELVMITKHRAAPIGSDAEVLVDIDLGILGSDPVRFDQYEIQIRDEYSWVPEPLYVKERRRILAEFADRPAIYCTEVFRHQYEAQARDNIARSLARL